MKKQPKTYRNLLLVFIFLFLQGQTCTFGLYSTYNAEALVCDRIRINSLEHLEDGTVNLTWDDIAQTYDIRLYYQNNIIGIHQYEFPSTSGTFVIDWSSLQGNSDIVVLEMEFDTFFTIGSCLVSRNLYRPVAPIANEATPMLCENLRLTSPLGGMANGSQSFYWDSLEGAVNYSINIYDNPESMLASWDTGNLNNFTMDISQAAIGGESPLLVELMAYDANNNHCSQVYEIAREAAPPQAAPPVVAPSPTATPTCVQKPNAAYC